MQNHHPGLIAPQNEDGVNLKSEIEEKVQTGIGRSQEYNKPSLEQFLKSNDFCNQNIYEELNGTDSVTAKCLSTYSNIEEESDFEVKIESDSCQVYNKDFEEQYMEVNNYNHKSNEADGGQNSVPVDHVQVDAKMEDQVVFEVEFVKIETDNYSEGSAEGVEEQMIEAEEKIEYTLIKRIGKPEQKFKRTVAEPKKKPSLKTNQHSMHNLRRPRGNGNNKLNGTVDNIFKADKTLVDLTKDKFVCQFCDYKAYRKSDLDRHLSYLHLNYHKFECHLCEYKASRKSEIARHVKCVHLKERKYECNFCEYKAYLKSDIARHLDCIHLKERKFECHLCEYKANIKSNLDKHLRCVHLKKKKCLCLSCSYKSNQKLDVKGHIDSVCSK